MLFYLESKSKIYKKKIGVGWWLWEISSRVSEFLYYGSKLGGGGGGG